jgi:hypothetical protein
MLLNPKHKSRGRAGRNPKQASKFEIQIFKTKSKTRIMLNSLAIQPIKARDMKFAILVFVIGTFGV